jgi:ParB-like chromosome segregation protein Spo0J
MQVFEPHPLANLFPLTEGPRFAEMCADIKARGLIHPIVRHEGRILDGRNRARACKESGVEPRFVEWETLGLTCSVEQYIWSANAQRRDLTPDQRAAISTQYSEHIRAIKAAAKERQKAAGKSGSKGGRGKKKTLGADSPAGFTDRHATRHKQAEEAGTTEHKVKIAEQVKKSRPDLISKVAAGEMKLADAAKQITPPPVKPKAEKPGKRQTMRQNFAKKQMMGILSTIRGHCRGLALIKMDLLLDGCTEEEKREWAQQARQRAVDITHFSDQLRASLSHDDPNKAALIGPRGAKTPGSIDWIIQTTRMASLSLHSLERSTEEWLAVVKELEEYSVWDHYPEDKPYGSRDAFFLGEFGKPEPELTRPKAELQSISHPAPVIPKVRTMQVELSESTVQARTMQVELSEPTPCHFGIGTDREGLSDNVEPHIVKPAAPDEEP